MLDSRTMAGQALSLLLLVASLGIAASVADDSIRRLPAPDQIFQLERAGWDEARHRVHVGSWPNWGGGYPQQEHLVVDARTGKRLRTLPAPWSGIDIESPGPDSIQAMRHRADAGLAGLNLTTTMRWDSVRRVSPRKAPFLLGFDGTKCMRIHQTHPKRIKVSPACCDPDSEKSTKPCHLPANEWVFWPAPSGRRGLLHSQVTQVSNDCTGGPVYSIVTWSESTCSDKRLLEP